MSSFQLLSSNEEFHVVVHRSDAGDAEVLDEHLGDVRREERREGRAKMDVLHAKVKERQQDDDGLLLVFERSLTFLFLNNLFVGPVYLAIIFSFSFSGHLWFVLLA